MTGNNQDSSQSAPPQEVAALREQIVELTIQLREMRETVDAIHGGDVDALVVNGEIYTLESAGKVADRLRRDVLSQMDDAVFAFDADDRIIYLNAAAESRYSVQAGEALGQFITQVFTEVAAPEEDDLVFARPATPSLRPAKLSRHILKDGSSIYVETMLSTLSGHDGSTMGHLAVVRDVSERVRGAALLRESEARLRHVNEDLETAVQARTRELLAAEEALRHAQKMEAVGQLTGGIAHDFNNLLAVISTSLQVLSMKFKRGAVDDFEKYINMAQGSVTRAASLTQRLLAFARRQTLDPKPIEVSQLVHGLVELIERTVGPTVRTVVEVAPDLWTARLDSSQLENSILNLCINARDAMRPSGGTLKISARNASLGRDEAAAHQVDAGDFLVIGVSDTGGGMSEEVAARAFDPFFTTKPVGEGTGLGLSMVYGFAQQSGGNARIKSVQGVGTTIEMMFPRFEGDSTIAASKLPQDVSDGSKDSRGHTVLLVEDEDKLRALMAEALEIAGFKVIKTPDGASALTALGTLDKVDLLLTDVGLPGGMNGRQLAVQVRERRPEISVLFVTGYAESSSLRSGGLEPGMALMNKPFDLAVLVEKAREMAMLRKAV
ncbi:PAS domain-containing sensor histidine kinase [Hydrogenophaga sp.]|uniref:hybrid sensor histidine kinase/response regulator n=1 Tax=Hydrogenophaga sp. TaxID=1904254 RepID=UPI0027251F1E|nr:PAS domain-containing sensor histidine kinase [Hydrogenophaga sp.]MDO9436607.1 response regulator [Hydrogenophaga sp.]